MRRFASLRDSFLRNHALEEGTLSEEPLFDSIRSREASCTPWVQNSTVEHFLDIGW